MELVWAEGQARASTCSSPWGSARHHPGVWETPAAHSTGNKTRLLSENKNAHGIFFLLKHDMLKNGETAALKPSSLAF